MTSIEQRRKPYREHGQDHGTRGTKRDKVAMRKALGAVKLNPEYAGNPETQKREFTFDLEEMRWSMRYNRHRDEVGRKHVQRNRLPIPGDPVEDMPTEDEIAPAPPVEKEIESDEAYINRLYRKLNGLLKELNNTPRNADGVAWVSQTDLDRRVDELEGEIEYIKEEIEEFEEGGKTQIPHATDAEMGLWTKKQREAYQQHKHGDMAEDDEDDHGLDTKDNGMRVHKLPKESWY